MDDRASVDADALPEELRSLVNSELAPGERLLWAARPTRQPPLDLRGLAGATLVPVSMFLVSGICFAALDGSFGPVIARQEGLFVTTGLLAGTLGFVVICGIIVKLGSRSQGRSRSLRTLYALTDRRAILWTPQYDLRSVTVQT